MKSRWPLGKTDANILDDEISVPGHFANPHGPPTGPVEPHGPWETKRNMFDLLRNANLGTPSIGFACDLHQWLLEVTNDNLLVAFCTLEGICLSCFFAANKFRTWS